MPDEQKTKLRLEIAHVLFIDIVGYSKLRTTEQSAQIQMLREIVRNTDQFRVADTEGKLLRLPTGDGGAFVYAREFPSYLAWAYSGLGQKDKALEQARLAVTQYDNDALVKPFAETVLAMVEADNGDSNSAIAALPHLLEVPNRETPGDLRIKPTWDPLRNDPRFQKFCSDK